MVQMPANAQEFLVDNNFQEYDCSQLGISPELNDIKKIQETRGEYEDLKNKTAELMNSSKYNKNIYLRIPYSDIKKEKYTVQSITKVDDKILISAYKSKNYSRLYIYDIETASLEGIIILDNKAHVGGISFDHDKDILYITGSNGEVNSYDYSVIRAINKTDNYVIDLSDSVEKKEEEKLEIKINNNINIRNIDKSVNASTIYYYDNRLYVATFNPTGKGYLYSYKVDYNSENKTVSIIDEHTKKYIVGARIQGIALTKYNNKDYLICSQSIGITYSSFLVYEMTDEELIFVGRTYIDDYGLEGITIDENNNLVGIFEHNDRPILVKSVEELLSEVSDSILDIWPGNELGSYVGGLVYKLTNK